MKLGAGYKLYILGKLRIGNMTQPVLVAMSTTGAIVWNNYRVCDAEQVTKLRHSDSNVSTLRCYNCTFSHSFSVRASAMRTSHVPGNEV